jgi:hypothetical protein
MTNLKVTKRYYKICTSRRRKNGIKWVNELLESKIILPPAYTLAACGSHEPC